MASTAGSAFIQLLPSLENFQKEAKAKLATIQLDKDVNLHVKVDEDDLAKAEAEVAAFSQKLADDRKVEEEAAQRVEQAEKDLAATREGVAKQAAQEVGQAESNVTDARNRSDEAQRRVRQSEDDLARARSDAAAADGRVRAAEDDLSRTRGNSEAAARSVRQREDELASARSSDSAGTGRAQQAEENLTRARQAQERADADVSRAESDLSRARAGSADANSRVASAEDNLSRSRRDASTASNNLGRAESDLQAARSRSVASSEAVRSAETNVANARRDHDNAIQRIYQDEDQLSQARSRASAVADRLRQDSDALAASERNESGAIGDTTRAEDGLTRARGDASAGADRTRQSETNLANAKRASEDSANRLSSAEDNLGSAHERSSQSADRDRSSHENLSRAHRDTEGSSTTLGAALRSLIGSHNSSADSADRETSSHGRLRLAHLFTRDSANESTRAHGALAGAEDATTASSLGATSAIGGMGQGMLLTAGIALIAAPAVGLVGTAILGIPGAIAVAAGPVAAIALGMDGIKAAAAAAKPALDQLKAAVSATFQAQLVPVFNDLRNVILPGVTKGMQDIASSLSFAATQVTNFIASARGMDLVNQILHNTGDFIRAISPALVSLTNGFLTLAATGTAALNRFAPILNGLMDQFNRLAQQLSSSGVLGRAFDQLGQTVGILISVFLRLVDAGARIYADMGPQLNQFLQLLGNIVIQLLPPLESLSERFIQVATPILNMLIPAVNAAAPVLNFLAGVIAGLLNWLQPLAPAIGVAAVLMGTFKLASAALSPVISILSGALKVLGLVFDVDLSGSIARSISAVGTWALQTVGNFIKVSASATAEGAVMVARWVGGFIAMSAAAVVQGGAAAAAAIGNFVRISASATVESAVQVARMVGAWVAISASAAVEGAVQLARMAGSWVAISASAAVEGAVQLARMAGSWVAMSVSAAIESAAQVASMVGGFIAMSVGAAIHGAAMVATMVGSFIAISASAIAETAVTVATTVGGYIAMAASAVLNVGIMVATTIGGYVAMAASAVVNAAISAGAILASFATMIAAAVVWAVGMAAAWIAAFWPIGLILVLVAGLVVALVLYWGQIRDATVAAFTIVRDFTIGAFTAVRDWSTNAMNTMVGAVRSAWDWIVGKFNDALNAIMAMVGAAWNWVVDKFTWLGDMERRLIGDAWDWISNKIATALNFIKDVFEKTWDWIVGKLTDVNRALVDSFRAAWDWIAGKIADVNNFIAHGIIEPIWNWMRDFIGKTLDDMVGAIGNAMNAMRDWFEKGTGWIHDKWEEIRGICAKPVNFVINTVYNDGIKKWWDAFAGWLHLPQLPAVQPIAEMATGGVAGWDFRNNDMRGGGKTYGGMPNQDSIPAMLMPGEYVISKPVVEKWGLSNIDTAHRYAREGRPLEGMFLNPSQAPSGSQAHRLPVHRKPENNPVYQEGLKPSLSPKWVISPDKVHFHAEGGPVVESFEAGGPAGMQRAFDFAKSMNGKPYILGGSSPAGTDCSGFMAMIKRAIYDQQPYAQREWATESPMPPPGFVPGLAAGFSIGIHHGGDAGGHTAGTLGNVFGFPPTNVESGGKHNNVAIGGPAVGADNSYFPEKYHVPLYEGPFASGGPGDGGGGGGGGSYAAAAAMHAMKHALTDPIRAAIIEPGANALVKALGYDGDPNENSATLLPGMAKQMPMQAYDQIVDGIDKMIDDFFGVSYGGGGGPAPPGLINDWIMAAIALVHGDPNWAAGIFQQIMTESSGNPGAIQQVVDVNSGPNAARGIMQTTPTTFAAFAVPGHTDIFNPVDNIAAAINYVLARYGPGWFSPGPQHSHGYDEGGYIPPGVTQVYNGTGKPEPVFNPTQWDLIKRNVESGATGGHPVTVNTYMNASDKSIQASVDRRVALAKRL